MRDGGLLMTDGPFAGGKEHLGGFTIITAPDLDAALAWGKSSPGPAPCRSRCGRSTAKPGMTAKQPEAGSAVAGLGVDHLLDGSRGKPADEDF